MLKSTQVLCPAFFDSILYAFSKTLFVSFFLAYIPFQYVKGRCGVAAHETNQFRAVKIQIIFFRVIKIKRKKHEE